MFVCLVFFLSYSLLSYFLLLYSRDDDCPDKTGGDGKVGKVIDIRGWDNESRRSVANVMWSSGSTNVYRLGHKGKVDLKCTVDAEGGRYYRDHLPVLGEVLPSVASSSTAFPAQVSSASSTATENVVLSSPVVSSTSSSSDPLVNTAHSLSASSAATTATVNDGASTSAPVSAAASASPEVFHVGDKVKVIVEDEDELKRLQCGHGGWNPRMARFLGRIGTIHRTTEHGDLRVKFPESQLRWTFNPVALAKIQSYAVDDVVRVIEDAERVRTLQAGHGEWIEQMRLALGQKGKIVKVYLDNDLRVTMDSGTTWTFNPHCVTLVSSAPRTDRESTIQSTEGESVRRLNEDGQVMDTQSEYLIVIISHRSNHYFLYLQIPFL